MHFSKTKTQIWDKKNLIPFLVPTLLLCSNIIFCKKKNIRVQNLTFCVYNVVQYDFFTQKIQKSQKVFFFVNPIIIFSFHLLDKNKFQAFFHNYQNFQSKSCLAIYKKLHFWYIIPYENVNFKVGDKNHQIQFICQVTASYTLGFVMTKSPGLVCLMKQSFNLWKNTYHTIS